MISLVGWVMPMQRLARSEVRHAALTAVHRDTVRYHNGCAGPALGFTWSDGVGGQMFEDLRHALRELWAADLVDVDTHRLFAHRGHRVTTTTRGYLVWRAWQDRDPTDEPETGASPTRSHTPGARGRHGVRKPRKVTRFRVSNPSRS